MKKKGFTLIELIAVLVILAILALIVTPLVMNIIRKAKISADRRSVDAYGRSVELAIATHLLDTGAFPTDLKNLNVEYTGKVVVCNVMQMKENGGIYLSECTVGTKAVKDSSTEDGWYHYGEITFRPYNIGDQVSYNNVEYYVIKDTGSNVTLLKAEPLTTAEVNQYGAGHINRYTSSSVGTSYNYNGYGAMAYYTSETCGKVNGSWVTSDCTTDYAQSDIKYAVDAWKTAQAPQALEARLITYEELTTDLGCSSSSCRNSSNSWLYNSNYTYWTKSQYNDSASYVWRVGLDGSLLDISVRSYNIVVRPVITISKSSI